MSALAIFTGLLAVASAITVPGGSNPTGPAIYQPGLNSVVPVGVPFTITWDKQDAADCGQTVDLVLLHGKSAATMQAISYIAQKTMNNGSLAWTPSTSLEPSQTGYGIELICSKSNAYQYTTEFGISNANYVADAKSSTATPTSTASALPIRPVGTGVVAPVYTTEVVTSFTTYCPEATVLAFGNKTYHVTKATTLTITDCPCTLTKAHNATATPAVAYGNSSSYGNSSIIKPTGSMTILPTMSNTPKLATTQAAATFSSSSAPKQTNGAAQFGASFGGFAIAAGVAVFAL
ncbi:hypothetical protein MBLNU457_3142t1 [Dothideomycetes sp. NU457]